MIKGNACYPQEVWYTLGKWKKEERACSTRNFYRNGMHTKRAEIP